MVAMWMICFVFYLAGPTWEQTIEWVDPYRIYGMYYQPGLIQKRDAIILYGQIDLGQTTGYDRVHYEIKKQNVPYSTLCYLYLSKCEGYKNSFCYCKTTSVANIFDVVINITADTSLSEAKVIGAIDTFGNNKISVEKSIPKIYDGTNIQVNMYVNGMIGNASNCNMEIKGNDVCIAVEIPDIVNLQYQLVLKNVRTNMVLRNESKIIFYSTQIIDTLQLSVYFQVYDLPNSQQQFHCFIQAKITEEKDNTFSVLFGFTLAFLLILLLLIVASFLFRKRILSYIESKNTKKKFRQSHKDEINSEYGNERNEEVLCNLLILREQKDEQGDEMTYNQSTASIEKTLIIPEQIIAKIKEVKGNKDNKKNPLVTFLHKISRTIAGPKEDFLSNLANLQLETMVSIGIEVVSNQRPKNWPGTKVSYPLSGKTSYKRKGYGRIINVTKFSNCNKHKSHVWRRFPSSLFSKCESQSREWVEVLIYISRHLIFDDFEAKHITCEFMLKNDLPGTVTFKAAIVRLANLEENWTLLSCFSNDISIFNNLQESLNNFHQTWTGIDITNVVSFIVYCHDKKIKKTNFADLFVSFNEDKELSFCLNTYFEKQNMAIYLERASVSMRVYQIKSDKGIPEDMDFSGVDSLLKLSSLPFIIKLFQKNKKIKDIKSEEKGTKLEEKSTQSEEKSRKSERKSAKSDENCKKSEEKSKKSQEKKNKKDDKSTKSEEKRTESEVKRTESQENISKSEENLKWHAG